MSKDTDEQEKGPVEGIELQRRVRPDAHEILINRLAGIVSTIIGEYSQGNSGFRTYGEWAEMIMAVQIPYLNVIDQGEDEPDPRAATLDDIDFRKLVSYLRYCTENAVQTTISRDAITIPNGKGTLIDY